MLGCAVASNALRPPWTVGLCDPHQAPLSMGFFRPEYFWSCPSPGDLPNPGIKPRSPALQADSLLAEANKCIKVCPASPEASNAACGATKREKGQGRQKLLRKKIAKLIHQNSSFQGKIKYVDSRDLGLRMSRPWSLHLIKLRASPF